MLAADHHRYGTHSDHSLGQHGAAGVAYIDPQNCHEAVDLLGDLQKSHCAQEPAQNIAGDRGSAQCSHLSLSFGFCNGESWDTQRRNNQRGQDEQQDQHDQRHHAVGAHANNGDEDRIEVRKTQVGQGVSIQS